MKLSVGKVIAAIAGLQTAFGIQPGVLAGTDWQLAFGQFGCCSDSGGPG